MPDPVSITWRLLWFAQTLLDVKVPVTARAKARHSGAACGKPPCGVQRILISAILVVVIDSRCGLPVFILNPFNT
jgi:hypothetical protein